MKKQSWWSRHGSQAMTAILRPSVARYLGKIFDVQDHCMFYHIKALARPPDMLQLGDVLEDQDHDAAKTEKYRFLVLYAAARALVSHPAGIV
jgi:uncharacterized protein YciW